MTQTATAGSTSSTSSTRIARTTNEMAPAMAASAARPCRSRALAMTSNMSTIPLVASSPPAISRHPSTAHKRTGIGWRTMTKWEYATVPLLIHATKQILDQWGEDGWELVTVLPNPSGEQHVAYLKRPKG